MKNLKFINLKKQRLLASWAFLLIPLSQPTSWHHFSFSNKQSNQVQHQSDGLSIKVNNSASPLIYVFPKSKKITAINVKAKVNGTMPLIPLSQTQGYRKNDDFVLRVGLIIKGESRLNWLQRQFAPDWLIAMEKLLPPNMGIDKVSLYTTCQQKKILHHVRTHFLNSRFVEECVSLLKNKGLFSMNKTLPQAKEVLGLWIGSDGDQTKSQFEVKINEIKLNYK